MNKTTSKLQDSQQTKTLKERTGFSNEELARQTSENQIVKYFFFVGVIVGVGITLGLQELWRLLK